MTKNTYIVERSMHGIQTFVVEADTGVEALEKVNNNQDDSECQAIDFNIYKYSKAHKYKKCKS